MSMRPLGSCATRSVGVSRRPEARSGPTRLLRPSQKNLASSHTIWTRTNSCAGSHQPGGQERNAVSACRRAELRLEGNDRFILPMDHMTQVGPLPIPLLDELDLEPNTVLCTLLMSENWLGVHRSDPQPDSLRNLDRGRLSQFDGRRKQHAHAVVRHIDCLPRDQAVHATHPTGLMELATWIQPFEALLFRHYRDLNSPKAFQNSN